MARMVYNRLRLLERITYVSYNDCAAIIILRACAAGGGTRLIKLNLRRGANRATWRYIINCAAIYDIITAKWLKVP